MLYIVLTARQFLLTNGFLKSILYFLMSILCWFIQFSVLYQAEHDVKRYTLTNMALYLGSLFRVNLLRTSICLTKTFILTCHMTYAFVKVVWLLMGRPFCFGLMWQTLGGYSFYKDYNKWPISHDCINK